VGIGPEEVRQRYGVDPDEVPDFIALRGDPSDKLPGAAGVGPKRAAQLVRRYGTLDGVLEAGLFQTQAEMLRLYRLIATMEASAPLPSLADQEPTWASAEPCPRLGTETIGRPLGGEDMTVVVGNVAEMDFVVRQ
jgi:DNA polymerase I